MSSRKIRYYDSSTGTTKTEKFSFNKSKRYKWNKSTGSVEEITSTNALAADELSIPGSKSSLRRMADLERNVSILASKAGVVAADNDDTDAVQKDSDRALRSYSPLTVSNDTITIHLGDGTSHSVTTSDANTNKYISSMSFNTGTGVLTATRNDGGSVTVDLDNRYQLAGSYASTGTTMTAGNGLTGGGNLGSNRTFHVGGGNGISVSADGVAMSGSYTGTFTATGDICAYSDASLKTNVQSIEGALDKVESVRGVTFDRIADGSSSVGVIAQELEAVLPEAVQTDENGVKMVAYGNVTGLLIEAVKELSAEVKSLKGE
jgi:hypothetical protein